MRLSLFIAVAGFTAISPALAQPEARFETSMGNFTILLEDAKAPKTVANFIAYVKSGHYNGTVFYRIVPDFVIQAGSMGANDSWRPLRKPIVVETAGGLSNTRGTIAMARDDKPLSTQAEFFINLADSNAQGLDPKPGDAPNTTGFAVFGHVTSGMDVVDAISKVPLGGLKGPFPDNYPKAKVVIRKVTIGVAPPAPPASAPDAAAVPGASAPAGDAAPQPPEAPTQAPTQAPAGAAPEAAAGPASGTTPQP